MDWLNYHHLHYFWMTAREGSITKACRKLHLTQPTVSGQIRALERSLQTRLFERAGRSLMLTDSGRVVFRYADEIFSIGRELQAAVADRPTGRPQRFTVGVTDSLPKVLLHKILEPALRLGDDIRLNCIDGEPDPLLARLALHELDLVITDYPASPRTGIKTYSHLLGECGVSFFAVDGLARSVQRGFPASLTGAPILLPAAGTTLRRTLDQWFDEQGIHPHVRGEFADSALLKSFGAVGQGVFAAPSAVEADVERMYGVRLVAREEGLKERFYAVSVEKRLKHPAVVAISRQARESLFGG